MDSGASRRVVELDALRFLAAFAVVVHHMLAYAATRLGYLGVELFFLISGYVILATATQKDGFSFVVGRIARLYPSFLIAVSITAGLLWWSGRGTSLPNYLLNMTMVPSFLGGELLDVVYWTLAIEIKFYAMIFLLIVSKQIPDIERWLLAWLSLCAASISFPEVRLLGHLALNGYGGLFAAGCLMFLIRRDGVAAPSRIAALTISLCLSIRQAVMDGIAGHVTETGEYFYLWIAGIVVAEYALFLALALRLWKLPPWRVWATMGAVTYPLYLLHNEASFAISRLLGTRSPAVMIAFGLSAALLLIFTSEKYLCPWVQRRLLALRPQWIPERRPQAVAVAVQEQTGAARTQSSSMRD